MKNVVITKEDIERLGEYPFLYPNKISLIHEQSEPFSVSFESGITHIPSHMFQNTYITDVTFPDSVEEIEAFAFADCNLLKLICLPPKLRTIGVSAFMGCSNLETVYAYSSFFVTRNPFTKRSSIFEDCNKVKINIYASKKGFQDTFLKEFEDKIIFVNDLDYLLTKNNTIDSIIKSLSDEEII